VNSISRGGGGWATLTAAAAAAVIIGFASTILILMQAAVAIGATPAQQASMASVLCYVMAGTTAILCWRYKTPIIVAWSTPGAVLIASSAAGITYQTALGAFVVSGVLMVITGLVKPFERAIEKMPPAIAAAMLAGVLVTYVLKVPAASIAAPWLVLPLVLAFFALRIFLPLYAVPVITVLGLALAYWGGGMGAACCALGITPLTFDVPKFEWHTMIGMGVPLYLVTMASQNLPGFAVVRAAGYQPPVSGALITTGTASILMTPFGGHAVNMAAITASLATGPDAHPDPMQRWKIMFPYFVMYGLIGLAAASFVQILGALPKELVAAIAGLALFGPLMGGMTAMMKEPKDIEAALVTFLVTASGLSLYGVGAAFWGLCVGLALWGVKQAILSPR
jgi:benzoate membrane transport protein